MNLYKAFRRLCVKRKIMDLLDPYEFEVLCPKCFFLIQITLGDIRFGRDVFCRGCKKQIMSMNLMNEYGYLENRIKEELRTFEISATNLLSIKSWTGG